MSRSRTLFCVVSAVLAVTSCASSDDAASIDARAAVVMPFDLERTTHTFSKTATGGVQEVLADDGSDAEQISLIRSHLKEETAKFRRGDFGDPAAIHGMDMPGLDALEAGYGRVDVVYREDAGGGMITYASSEPALVEAIHAWFDRQTMDHG